MEFIRSLRIKCSGGQMADSLEEAQRIELADILRSELDPANPKAGQKTAEAILRNKDRIIEILRLKASSRPSARKPRAPKLSAPQA